MDYFLIISGVVLGIVVGWVVTQYFMKNKSAPEDKEMPELIQKQEKEKEANKQKVLKFLEGKDKITNNDVEKMLGVSNATAERYLDELEKEGIIKQVGKTGKYTYYNKI